jgi:hypothetical protein
MMPSGAEPRKASFAPPKGKTLLLVGQDGDTIAHYVRATGNIPGGIMLYTSNQRMEGLNETFDDGSGPMNGNALLKTYPNSVVQVGLYIVDELNDTLTGKYNDNLKILAQWIKKADRPIYLRIGYEFDLPENHYEPLKYKQTFQYVVNFLRREGVKNAAYVWHTDCSDHPGKQWMDWYPGDDYVDWFGVSLFSTEQIPRAANFLKLARQHGKPFMICESTPWTLYTLQAKIDWLKHIFQFIKDRNVEAFCYIDSNWDKQPAWASWKIGDARVEKSVKIKNLWLNNIADIRYLNASPNLFRTLGWTPSKT